MLILTDFARFPKEWKTSAGVDGSSCAALIGASAVDLLRLIPEIRRADVLLVHESGSKALWLALLFWFAPFLRKPVVVVDLILRKPTTAKKKLIARLKKRLLQRIDHFIFYFQDLEGYERFYGISPQRCSYVPFKANIFSDPRADEIARAADPGDYIFTAGQSLRDFDTYFAAVARLHLPAALPKPNFARLAKHGARFTWPIDKLPANVTLLDDDGTPESWLRNLAKARVVVIPTLRDSLCASGIGTYLDAMLLRKCVIISSGPGVSDLLRDEAIIVAPEDPEVLAEAIRNAWENPVMREAVAHRGRHYAETLGGEPELLNRILNSVLDWYSGLKK